MSSTKTNATPVVETAVVTTPTVETTPTPTPAVIEYFDRTPAIAEGLTPYAAAKMVNEVYAAHGSTKKIPTQMMYNYTTARINAGKKAFIPVNKDGRINGKGLQEWMTRYFAKQGIKA